MLQINLYHYQFGDSHRSELEIGDIDSFLRLHDLSPLAPIIANPDIIVLLHGAGADMRFMAERGLVVAHYYDL